MAKLRGLGKGFDALFPIEPIEPEFDPTVKKDQQGRATTGESVEELPIAAISANPHQPRQEFNPEALQALAESIKQHGILQPLVVVKSGEGYQLIAGERRLRAAKLLKRATVPAIVRSFSAQESLELALIENIQREDLNPIETATAYRKLLDQFNLKEQDIAKRVGKDQSTIINSVRLLRLPTAVKRAIASGEISEGHGRAILSITGEKEQLKLLQLIKSERLTVRQAEEYGKQLKSVSSARETIKRVTTKHPLAVKLSRVLRTDVSIEPRAKGGRLVIRYQNDQELEEISKRIGS